MKLILYGVLSIISRNDVQQGPSWERSTYLTMQNIEYFIMIVTIHKLENEVTLVLSQAL